MVMELAREARRLKFNFAGLWHSEQVHNALCSPVILWYSSAVSNT
jgi:hypothetical protein